MRYTMKKHIFELFRLEDRVLFEAAAVAEIVDAAEAAQENPNANVNETEKQEPLQKTKFYAKASKV